MQIYHNPRCAKSREGLQVLKDKNIAPDIILYLKTPPTETELKPILKKLGITAEELIRKGEKIYKEEFKGKKMSEDKWIEAMVAYPKLIERPIIINGDNAVIGRPSDKILSIL